MANIPTKILKATGKIGGYGENGATFTPHVSEDGVLSWTNDKGLANPTSVKIARNFQADMSVNDESDPSYVKNRTHWTEPEKEEQKVFTWDGNTNGLVVSTCSSSMPPKFYKVADLPEGMAEEDILALDYTKMIVDGDTPTYTELFDVDFTGNGARVFGVSSPKVVMTAYDNAYFPCSYYGAPTVNMYFPEAGIYAVSSVTEFSFVCTTPEVIHTIAHKYLPEPYVLDTTVYGSSVIPADVGDALLENLLAGVQSYVYDGIGYNSIARWEANSVTDSRGVTTHTLVIYYSYLASGSLVFTSKSITINDPDA